MEISYSRKGEGVAQICGPYGELFDIKTVTCGHCSRVMYVSPFGDGTAPVELPPGVEVAIVNTQKREPPAVCHQCWSLVCPQCHAKGSCTPLLQSIEKEESSRRFFEAVQSR